MSGRIGAVMALAAAAALLSPAVAAADVTCNHDDAADVLQVFLSDTGPGTQTSADMQRAPNGDINVVNNGTIACTGPQATITNIDKINASDVTASGNGNVSFSILRPEEFAPGVTIENGSALFSEIEFNVTLGGGDDGFSVFGSDGPDRWRFDSNDINFGFGSGDPSPDSELDIFTGVEGWQLDGYLGDDVISGRGQSGVADLSGVFDGAGRLDLTGGSGSDTLEGGDGTGGDFLNGQDGDDVISGFAGPDQLLGHEDDDTLTGGNGVDLADYTVGPPVSVDLALTGPQDTGQGTDTLSEVEIVRGSDAADTLRGDGGPNSLMGMRGDDSIAGRGGNDMLFGGDLGVPLAGGDGDDALAGGAGDDGLTGSTGVDTVTFADATAGVSADLGAGTATGEGTDTIATTENIVGSPFADTLTGSGLANSITAGGGADTVSALAGADAVDVRDGGPDTASCGTDIDTATADRASVDSVDPDCETTSFLPEPEPEPEPGGGGETPTPDVDVAFDLAGKAKQRVLRRKAVVVRATCPLEDCAASFAGKVKPRSEELAAAETEKLKLKLKRAKLRAIAKALRAGKKPKVTVRAAVTDAAGNEARDRLSVRAKR